MKKIILLIFLISSYAVASYNPNAVVADNNGNVGIKTHGTTPGQLLQIGSYNAIEFETLTDTVGMIRLAHNYSYYHKAWDIGCGYYYGGNDINRDNFIIKIMDATDIAMVITPSGNIGIGIATPVKKVHIGGISDVLRVGPYYTSGGDRDYIDIIADQTDTRIKSINERFHIENTGGALVLQGTGGNVGIGTNAPSAKLEVVGGNTKLEQEAWSADVFSGGFPSGWGAYSSGYDPKVRYYKDSNGVVHFKGIIAKAAVGGYTTLFTLPVGYRPFTEDGASFLASINSYTVKIDSNGIVSAYCYDAGGYLTMNQLTFSTSTKLA